LERQSARASRASPTTAALSFFVAHLGYYQRAARHREAKDLGPGKLHFHQEIGRPGK